MRKTENKYDIDECPRCGESHTDYRGKLNAQNEEYVVCGNTHTSMRCSPHPEWKVRHSPIDRNQPK